MSPYRAGSTQHRYSVLTPSTAWILKSLRGKARTTNNSVPGMMKWSDYNIINNNNACYQRRQASLNLKYTRCSEKMMMRLKHLQN